MPSMRLSNPKTWSQQELAAKLRVDRRANHGLLNWERRRLLIHATKTALSAALCWWIAIRFGLHDGYWGAISAIIVLQSNFGATISASRDRILGTMIGAAFGFAFSLFGVLPWNYILAVLSAVILCGLLGLRNSSRLAGVTISIVMLVQKTGSHWLLALHRVGEVFLGILVAVVVSTLVFPDRARLRLRDGLAQEFLVLDAFFEGILQGFRGVPAQNLPELRQDSLAMLRGNNALLEEMRNEPSGGPGWREGLGMLAQFGRTIFDALVALELAVRESYEDRYAQQLEPELGRLVTDIESGFQYVAKCIHGWRFHVAPPNLNLEQDIAELEERMAKVRHTGFSFSQAEILRAYAVQLHLKQIAVLLRASRVETSRAIGEAQPKES
ncbi:FUSC family protein [Telmatobacter sp. DSM 110680]|uniref:FUSC family protein n=1 Tax=Telmatobacter sp. DSM 110680 TaxID=3036704 RepID=A0AAU7DQT1_9BACT